MRAAWILWTTVTVLSWVVLLSPNYLSSLMHALLVANTIVYFSTHLFAHVLHNTQR